MFVVLLITLIVLISFSETVSNFLAGSLVVAVYLAILAAGVGFMWVMLTMYFN